MDYMPMLLNAKRAKHALILYLITSQLHGTIGINNARASKNRKRVWVLQRPRPPVLTPAVPL